MSPEMALRTFEQRAARQLNEPVSYSANTVVEAELPDTSQKGEYRLRRRFIAPKTLLFTPVRFVGDNFVKSNIIARLLQAEVDHVNKGEGAQTAINEANYKFSYKGADEIDGGAVYVFQVKPRGKRPGLFKGRIYLDASQRQPAPRRGHAGKDAVIFIKKIEFVQDYADSTATPSRCTLARWPRRAWWDAPWSRSPPRLTNSIPPPPPAPRTPAAAAASNQQFLSDAEKIIPLPANAASWFPAGSGTAAASA